MEALSKIDQRKPVIKFWWYVGIRKTAMLNALWVFELVRMCINLENDSGHCTYLDNIIIASNYEDEHAVHLS